MYLRKGLARLITNGVISNPFGFYGNVGKSKPHQAIATKFANLTQKFAAPLTRLYPAGHGSA